MLKNNESLQNDCNTIVLPLKALFFATQDGGQVIACACCYEILCNRIPYIYNNKFILLFILRKIKMADCECRQLEIGLEFVH